MCVWSVGVCVCGVCAWVSTKELLNATFQLNASYRVESKLPTVLNDTCTCTDRRNGSSVELAVDISVPPLENTRKASWNSTVRGGGGRS